ncbi:hypothetical protein H0H93_015537 [Arthromyces matolae]|nr:hypothetical protein H0H93_015537 [Arthromyces matolae]
MNNKGSFGMTVDQILLTLSDIASSRHQGRVLIFPHTEVSGLKSKDCKLEHWDPVSEARLQLFGPLQVDYTVMQSFDVHVEDRYHQDVPTALNSGILNRIFFVDLAPNGSYRLMPSKITAAAYFRHPEIRFCVTTGLWWCFFVVKTKHGKLSYHFSTDDLQRELRLDPYRGIEDFMSLEDRLQRLRQLMVLVSEWVRLDLRRTSDFSSSNAQLNPQTPGLYIRSTAK